MSRVDDINYSSHAEGEGAKAPDARRSGARRRKAVAIERQIIFFKKTEPQLQE
jgi:hypothetical protein